MVTELHIQEDTEADWFSSEMTVCSPAPCCLKCTLTVVHSHFTCFSHLVCSMHVLHTRDITHLQPVSLVQHLLPLTERESLLCEVVKHVVTVSLTVNRC